ncbi:MerR family transcriptional regulator [Succiniclasticum ruminis]|uniref:DNA-binding transcriptional regulator, MerR family n=1 Tax=Succiniclasticum ruminis DSM 9236 TaxID=1123323 RepID=A0A1I1Z1R2_9FIRM|nr:MerR family transcriptional regulator [Succiniclasticum ruminis]SFE25158.1 DNA-binding transcriptional regulator, MerR family [Succiniclasticum ruminis DSM 9236]
MSYTISEAAEKTGLPPSTIRFYDKEGLLPNIKRKNGIRVFEDMDLRLMGLLTCLKNTGMPIKRIRNYVELTSKGDETLQARYEIIKAQRQFVLDQIEQLQYYLEELDFKDWYYNKALATGSESAINLDDYEKETGKKAPDDPNRED